MKLDRKKIITIIEGGWVFEDGADCKRKKIACKVCTLFNCHLEFRAFYTRTSSNIRLSTVVLCLCSICNYCNE